MPDSVAYTLLCDCKELIYVGGYRLIVDGTVRVRFAYYPDLTADVEDVHEAITNCPACGANLKEVEERQYDEASQYLP